MIARYLGQGRNQRRSFMTVAGFFAIDAIVVALLAVAIMAFFAWGSHRRAPREKDPPNHASRSQDGHDAMSN
jgi:hypothetical protein